METSILTTKLHIPTPRAGIVSRPRLVERLDEWLQGKLTLISAPAGYGKTTLVSAWLDTIQTPAAWFSIDEGDSDLSRFLAYLASALQARFPDTGESLLIGLQSPQPPTAEHLLTTLINDVHEIESDFILVLDDYHIIDIRSAHDTVSFLLDNMPSQMHLVLAGRNDPPLPLSRLRVSGNLNEIRSADLRFTKEVMMAEQEPKWVWQILVTDDMKKRWDLLSEEDYPMVMAEYARLESANLKKI